MPVGTGDFKRKRRLSRCDKTGTQRQNVTFAKCFILALAAAAGVSNSWLWDLGKCYQLWTHKTAYFVFSQICMSNLQSPVSSIHDLSHPIVILVYIMRGTSKCKKHQASFPSQPRPCVHHFSSSTPGLDRPCKKNYGQMSRIVKFQNVSVSSAVHHAASLPLSLDAFSSIS